MKKTISAAIFVGALCMLAYASRSSTGVAAASPAVEEHILIQQRLIAACMSESGYTYVAELPRSYRAFLANQKGDVRGEQEALSSVGENDAYLSNLAPDAVETFWDTYWGTPATRGCYDKTFEAAWDPNGDVVGVLRARGEQVLQFESSSETLRRASHQYVACMASLGLPVPPVRDGGVARYLYDQRVRVFGEQIADAGWDFTLPGASDYEQLENRANSANDGCIKPYERVRSAVHAEALTAVWGTR
jgi:hypothetical protein